MGDYNDPFNRNRDAAVQARAKVQNRANVLQLKLIGQSHPTGLTSNLLKLFEPRPPLEYKPPPEKRKSLPYTGMAQFVSKFAEPGEPEYAPPVQKAETPAQRKARIQRHQLEKGAIKAAEELQKYDPSIDPNISGDPYKTLFVARLSYETTEHRIKREFEAYGPIKRVGILEQPQGELSGGDASCGAKLYTLKVRLITNKETNKPRGYAFVEYMHTRDMKTAYKQADGQKMEGRRVLVDVERGRTVPNWRPRRLGGGLGSTRVGGEELNQKYSGREPQQFASGAARSEEPRAREDRHVDREREKSRDRGRDREREKSRERSHDRIRERDPREERHHRDRDRNRDRDRERDRGLDHDRDYDWSRDRDRGRGRDRDRDRNRDYGRDRDRGRDIDRDGTRDHRRSRERDYERGDRERTRERESEYDYGEPRRKREVEEEREGELEHGEHGHDHEQFDRGYKQPKREEYDQHVGEPENDREQYEQKLEPSNGREPYDLDPAHDYDRYEKADGPDGDHNQYDQAETDLPRERAREGYERLRRSISRDYER